MLINMNKPIALTLLLSGCMGLYSCNSDAPKISPMDAAEAISTRNIEGASEEEAYAYFFKDPFVSIDDHAGHSSKEVEKDIPTLAKFLKEGTKSDLDKARAIYVWLAKNVSYDANGYNNSTYGDGSAANVLKTRIAVCEGFSNLFLALGKEMGLEIEKVVGYAKGYGFARTAAFKQTNHAWNRIKINGEWRIFDATWGEGFAENIGGKVVCTKQFDNYWFNIDPYKAIFDHYPQDQALAGVSPAIDLEAYRKLPAISKNYFRIGFDAKKTYETVLKAPTATFPKCYDVKTPILIVDAPAQKDLVVGKSCTFRLVIPAALKVALLDEHSNWNYMKEDNTGAWAVTYTPTDPGKISILLNDGSKGASFGVLLAYDVVAASTTTLNNL
jgi:hypothetical protein